MAMEGTFFNGLIEKGALCLKARKVMRLVSFTFVGGERTLKPESIVYVQTEGHRNIFNVIEEGKRQRYRLYWKLDEIEKILIPYGFVRCHRSCLVNIRYVKKVSNYLMELTTGEILTIPRARFGDVRDAFYKK